MPPQLQYHDIHHRGTLVAPTTLTYMLTKENPSDTNLIDLSASPAMRSRRNNRNRGHFIKVEDFNDNKKYGGYTASHARIEGDAI